MDKLMGRVKEAAVRVQSQLEASEGKPIDQDPDYGFLTGSGAEPPVRSAFGAYDARKTRPVATGVLDYFPDALQAVAYCSYIGNFQHNPGEPLHWAKEKSTDEADALVRHLLERGKVDTDGVRHSAKVAWRALAMLQREIEAENGR